MLVTVNHFFEIRYLTLCHQIMDIKMPFVEFGVKSIQYKIIAFSFHDSN